MEAPSTPPPAAGAWWRSPHVWLLGAALLAAAAGNVWFLRANRVPPSFDEAWYLENSCRFFHALRDSGPWAFAKDYAASFRFKAPLLSVLPLPAYFVAGPSLNAALTVNLAALIAIGVYLYLFGAKFFSRTAGLLAAAMALTCPLLFGLSRMFFVEVVLTTLVTAAAYHLAASEGLRVRSGPRVLGLLLGLGLLAKILFPLYLAGPAAELLWRRWREQGRDSLRALEPPLKAILLIGAAIALTWYANNLLFTFGYVARASFGDIGAHYGSSSVWSPAVLLTFWDRLSSEGLSYYYVVAAAAAAAALAIKVRPLRERALAAWHAGPGLRCAVLWLALPALAMTVSVGKDVRFFAPCIPAFALLLAAALDRLTSGLKARPVLLALFFLVPFDQYSLQTFGRSVLPPLTVGPLALLRGRTAYSRPPSTQGQWDQDRLVRDVARDGGPGHRTVAVGLEHVFLNANLLAYLAARDGLPVDFVHYGHMEDRMERAVARLVEKDVDLLLLFDGIPAGELLPGARLLDAQMRALLAQGRLPFRRVKEYPLTPGIRASLYERTGPIRMFGAPPP